MTHLNLGHLSRFRNNCIRALSFFQHFRNSNNEWDKGNKLIDDWENTEISIILL